VPVNQLMMQKLVVNQAIEAMGLKTTQLIATVFDGITRHSPEGVNFKRRAETVGWSRPSATGTTAPRIGPRTARSIPVDSLRGG